MVMTQTQLLQREVYLIDRIDNRQREKMRHLRCICFVRPTGESVQALVEELREPRYGDYYLCESRSGFAVEIVLICAADGDVLVAYDCHSR